MMFNIMSISRGMYVIVCKFSCEFNLMLNSLYHRHMVDYFTSIPQAHGV